MSETEANSNNRGAVTRAESDAVSECDNSGRQMKVRRMLNKLKSTVLKGMTKLKMQRNPPSTDLPTDPAFDRNEMDEADLLQNPSYGTFENTMEKKQWKDLIILIKKALATVREDKFSYEILIPCGLVLRIARDIMAMARKEPCGLRGCVLFINLEDKNKCQNLVKLACDPMTVSTFELYLTLKEDTRGWCMLKKFLISMSGCLDKKKKLELKLLCSGYQLDKKKLYRSNHD